VTGTPEVVDGFTRSGEIEIHYRVMGSGEQTLVLVNGVGDDLDGWVNQSASFLAAGLRLVTFDNRGVGRSGRPPGPYTSARMAADLASVADELEIARFHLAGVSMGGVIAQEYAVAHPGRLASLVLANTFAKADPFTRAAFDTWAIVAETAGMPVMTQQQAPWIFSPAFYARDPGRVAELVAGAQQSTQPAAAFAAQMAALNGHDCTGRIGGVTVPTLVLAASDDIIIRPQLSRELFELMPGGSRTWAVVPGGHAAFWEDPEPWNQAVIEFVRANGAGGDSAG
jgi:pimeloyl-ACP methyl ester carboxylesterase